MNFLAHLWLADAVGLPLAGAILGDVVRGRIEMARTGLTSVTETSGEPTASAAPRYEPEVAHSILMHRRIDAVTDRHPRVLAAVRRFEPSQRRYAGILLDLIYDHVLAAHWSEFGTEPLPLFARRAARDVAAAGPLFAGAGARAPIAWSFRLLLVSYARIEGMDRAIRRTAHRLRRPEGLINAAEHWERHIPLATTDLRVLLPDLTDAARAFVAEAPTA